MAKIEGAGGTSGGIRTFMFGLGMTIAGGFLFVNHIQVGHSYRFGYFFGRNAHGLILLPLIVGIGFMFFNSKSIVGWGLTGGGALIIFLSVITSLRLSFPRTSLYSFLVMMVLLVGGLGLVLRSLRERKQESHESDK